MATTTEAESWLCCIIPLVDTSGNIAMQGSLPKLLRLPDFNNDHTAAAAETCVLLSREAPCCEILSVARSWLAGFHLASVVMHVSCWKHCSMVRHFVLNLPNMLWLLIFSGDLEWHGLLTFFTENLILFSLYLQTTCGSVLCRTSNYQPELIPSHAIASLYHQMTHPIHVFMALFRHHGVWSTEYTSYLEDYNL